MRLVVLDFDGTVAETRDAVSTTLNAALRAHDLPGVHPPFIHGLMGLPLDELVRRLIPPTEDTVGVPEVVAWYRAHFDVLGAAAVRLLPGAQAFFDAAAARGVPLAIATSREGSSLAGLLTRLGLQGRFVAVSTCDLVARGKPAPDLLVRVLADTEVDATEAVMVGDTPWDLQMASAAGVRAIGVTTGTHGADALGDADAVYADLGELAAAWWS